MRGSPITRGDTFVQPAQLLVRKHFIVAEITDFKTLASLQQDDPDATGTKLMCDRTAAGSGPNHHDHGIIVEIELHQLFNLPAPAANPDR